MMKRFFQRFRRDESGATAIEYGMILSLMFLVILGALNAFGATGSGLQRCHGHAPQRHGRLRPYSPVCSLTPSASASRIFAEPRGSGFCWLSCGAQPARCTISKVAGMRPSASA